MADLDSMQAAVPDSAHKRHVLVIDDDAVIRANLEVFLVDSGFRVSTAGNGKTGIAEIRSGQPDIVLVDLQMPEVNGMEVIRFAAGTFPFLPVVVISGTGVLQDVIEAMRFGAWDFVSKPLINMDDLHCVMSRCLGRAEMMQNNEVHQQELETIVAERTAALATSHEGLKVLQRATVESLSRITGMHNNFTGIHQKIVAGIARRIAIIMGYDEERANAVEVAGLLHDIGHLSVPSEFLSKPGTLTELEWAFVHTHPRASYEVLSAIPFEYPIADMILQHHERMNGSGYPDKRTGTDILPEARILAVADMMEAMLAHRPYRPACTMDDVERALRMGRGVLYCPHVTDVALQMIDKAASVEALLQGRDNED